MELTLQAMSSPHWEIRNAAGWCFSALTVRILGFKNDKRGASMTFSQMCQRHPQLYSVFLDVLKTAASQNDTQGLVSPGLFPVLSILARLE